MPARVSRGYTASGRATGAGTLADEVEAEQDPLVVARRDVGGRFLDLQLVQSTDLHDGPRAKKTAKFITIKNRHTGAVHHHSLTLETHRKLKGSYVVDEKKSITLDDEHADQIGALAAFIRLARGGADEPEPFAKLLELVEYAGGDIAALRALVAAAKARPARYQGAAAAIDFGRLMAGYEGFKALLDADAPPAALRAHLRAHAWLFGNPLVPLEAASALVPGAAPDFDVRRPLEGGLEVVMVQAPLTGHPLFVFDEAHGVDQPRAELAAALGLALAYLDAAAAARAERPRALLVIGRDGDEAEREALARLNGRLQGVQVVTFDHLRRVGKRVLAALREASQARVDP